MPHYDTNKEPVQPPDWFSLDKYKGTKDLDALGWLTQISFRKNIIFCMKMAALGKRHNPDYDIHDTAIEIPDKGKLDLLPIQPGLNELFDNPLSCKAPSGFVYGGELLALTTGKHPYSEGIFDITPRVWMQLGSTIPLPKLDFLLDNYSGIPISFSGYSDWEETLNNDYQEWLDLPMEKSFDKNWTDDLSTSYLSVNHNIPDKILREQFEKHLKDFRSKAKTTGLPSANNTKILDYRQWHDKKILPYLDITLWENLKRLEGSLRHIYTNEEWVSLLYPDKKLVSYNAEQFRKTITPTLTKILQPENLERLASVAATETYKNPDKR